MWGRSYIWGSEDNYEGVFFSSTKWMLKAELRLAGTFTH